MERGDLTWRVAEFSQHCVRVLAETWHVAHHRLLVGEGEGRQHRAHRAARCLDGPPPVASAQLLMVPGIDRLVQPPVRNAGLIEQVVPVQAKPVVSGVGLGKRD